jgi:hypothetical protein
MKVTRIVTEGGGIKHRLGATISIPASLEISLLQLNFPVLLRESTTTAAPRDEAVVNRTATNTIAFADFFSRANLSPHPPGSVRISHHLHTRNPPAGPTGSQ